MKARIFRFIFASLPFVMLYIATAGGVSAAIRERLDISTSKTKAYSRLIFHSEQTASFKPFIKGNQLVVPLNEPFWTNLANVTKKLSDHILSADISKDGKTLYFTLAHPEQISLRPFIGESFVGVDLVKKLPPAKAPEKTMNVANGTIVFESASIQDTLPTNFQLAQQEIKEIAIDNALSATSPATQKEFAAEPLPEEQNASAVTETTLSEEAAAATIALSEEEASLPAATETLLEQAPEPNSSASETTQTELPIASDVTIDDEAPSASATATAEETNDELLPALQTKEEDSALQAPDVVATSTVDVLAPPPYSEIEFSWSKPTAAAIFRRGDYVWLAFNEPSDAGISNLVSKYNNLFTEGEQIENRKHTILRLKLHQPLSVGSYKKDQSWFLTLTTRRNPPTQPFHIRTNNSNLHGSSLEIESTQFAEPLRITDPFVGDQLIVIPSYEAEAGIGTARNQIDFKLLESAQGLAVQLKADNIQVEQKKFGLALSGPTNRITNAESQALREQLEELKRKREEARQAQLAEDGEQSLLKFHSWQGDNNFVLERQRFEEQITLANWENKNPFRLELARFYLAHSMEIEALGVIATIRAFDPIYGARADVLLAEGAANYLAGRYQDATTALSQIDVEPMADLAKAEVLFWLAASELKVGSTVRMDKFVSRHPLKDEKKQNEQSDDKVEITQLILDTSSRLLKMIKKIDPKLATSEEIQTLESTARFVSNHYQDVIKRFGESEIYRSGDIFEAEDETLWWNTSGIRQKGKKINFTFLENRLLFLKDYPTEIYNDFALLSLEERLENNDISTAERVLETFRPSEDSRFNNNLTYLRGLFYAKDEEIDLAIETWEPLTKDVMDRYNRARSQFAMTGVMLKAGRIDTDQAIANFNGLRAVWRGDILELNLLKLLGEFYMDRQQYMQAFTTWREVLTNFSGSEDALLIAKKMNQEFVYLFNSGGAKNLSQLEALTLYYEFRELTPVGKQGDQMILKLVDRLVEVDLLDRATALLTHLVRFRLTGEEKHLASTRLAEIYLMANQYEKALDALTATKSDRIDDELATKRRYIKVKSLIALKQNNQALALLRTDETVEAAFLRADIYWRNKVWRKVVDELEYPFKEIIREERMLTPKESEALNKIAISYALMGNKKRLRILQEDFSPYASPEQQQLLAFIANDENQIDYRNLEMSLGLGKMEDFLKNYMAAGGNAQAEAKAP